MTARLGQLHSGRVVETWRKSAGRVWRKSAIAVKAGTPRSIGFHGEYGRAACEQAVRGLLGILCLHKYGIRTFGRKVFIR